MPTEITTSVQEGIKIVIVLVDNHGFASIGSLSRSLGQGGFGTSYRVRSQASGQLDGDRLAVDFAANARSLGAHALKASTLDELKKALEEAKSLDRTTVIVVETDASVGVPGYESWWDVAVAEVSEMDSVREAIETFVSTSLEPAVLEPGEPFIPLLKDHYALEQRGQRLTIQVWDDQRNLVRRILRIEQQKRGRLTLAVEKFARREGLIDLIDRGRPSTQELQRKSSRMVFRERLNQLSRSCAPVVASLLIHCVRRDRHELPLSSIFSMHCQHLLRLSKLRSLFAE